MPNFAANLTMMYNEVDFLDRFDAAAQSGFKGVEYLFPYAYDKDALADRLARLAAQPEDSPLGVVAGQRGQVHQRDCL